MIGNRPVGVGVSLGLGVAAAPMPNMVGMISKPNTSPHANAQHTAKMSTPPMTMSRPVAGVSEDGGGS
jgi:hypothetical protein